MSNALKRCSRCVVGILAGLVFLGSCERVVAPTTNMGKASRVRVLLISIDGLRPDAITSNAPTLLRIAKEGAATASAQTVLPSLTLPAHTSMVTGLTPEHHHVDWNDDVTVDPA